MNILFLNPPTIPYNILVSSLGNQKTNFSQFIAMPMGILYLGAVIQKSLPDANIEVVDFAKILRECNNLNDREVTSVKGFLRDALKNRWLKVTNQRLLAFQLCFQQHIRLVWI